MERLRILIVEDDRDTAEFFQRMLGLFGFDCEIALSAKKALAALATSVPDVILLDMRLGGEIGGEDILYQIRSNPRMSYTRVIVITAYPTTTELVSNLADLVLVKPVELDQLRTLVQRLGTIETAPKLSPFLDPITELYNQEFLTSRLELAFERVKRRDDFIFAVLVFEAALQGIDEEQHKPDQQISLLRALSERLRYHMRSMDTVARLAGMKFAALYEELKSPEDIRLIIQRLKEKLAEPFLVEGEVFLLSTCFGAALNTTHWRNPSDILEAAGQALGVAAANEPGGIYIIGLPQKPIAKSQ